MAKPNPQKGRAAFLLTFSSFLILVYYPEILNKFKQKKTIITSILKILILENYSKMVLTCQ